MPCNDLRFAVWSPELVLIPLNSILDLVTLFNTSSLVTTKSSVFFSSSIFSMNSGIIDIDADLNVYLVNRIVCPA